MMHTCHVLLCNGAHFEDCAHEFSKLNIKHTVLPRCRIVMC